MKKIKGLNPGMLKKMQIAASKRGADATAKKTVRESLAAFSDGDLLEMLVEIDATIDQAGLILDGKIYECSKCGGCDV